MMQKVGVFHAVVNSIFRYDKKIDSCKLYTERTIFVCFDRLP
jgi:hypothetical protein